MQRSLESFVGGLTIAELAQRSGKSVEDLVDWAMGGKSARASKPGATPSRKRKAVDTKPARRPSGGAVNTRTAEGRAAFDRAVIEALVEAGKAVGATPLIRKVGGTSLQMRTALARLVEAEKAVQRGRARATVYEAR